MTAVQAVYDGDVFIPEKPCKITKGSKVTLTISTADSGSFEIQKKLAAFRKLTKEVIESNETDSLSAEFDEIISQRMHIRENTGL